MAARIIPISQFTSDEIGIGIFDQGAQADPDGQAVTLGIVRDADSVQVVADGTPANRVAVGIYNYRVMSDLTAIKGPYTATWRYTLAGQPYEFITRFIVSDPSPFWDSLNADQRTSVENVYLRVADMYDSSLNNGGGGPYLWEIPQSNFGYETIARLMVTEAMAEINFSKPKDFNPPFGLGAKVPNPIPAAWYPIVEQGTYWALLKHLQRSYAEQPLAVGVTTARMDRRDYFDRYGFLIQQEKLELNEKVRMMKRRLALAGTRTRAMVVAGGIFPISYLDPARPRWPYVIARF